jgi:ATP-dependent Clp protease ATP-binding subunit ClpA
MLDLPSISTLAPYARGTLERCRDFALRIHADEAGPEHLLCALMEDEDAAAHRAVQHAFADPATIAEETLALASGILVSGSAVSLPFSPGGVRALSGARELAARRSARAVETAHVLLAAARALPHEAFADLEAAGWSDEGLTDALEDGGGGAAVTTAGALFRHYSEDAKRLMAQSAKTARQDGAPAIGPAHLLLACLGAELPLAHACGVSVSRARVVLRGRTHDQSEVERRALDADDALVEFLDGLAPGATTLELLERFHCGGTAELAQLLERHRVTPALLERVQGVFADPEST